MAIIHDDIAECLRLAPGNHLSQGVNDAALLEFIVAKGAKCRNGCMPIDLELLIS